METLAPLEYKRVRSRIVGTQHRAHEVRLTDLSGHTSQHISITVSLTANGDVCKYWTLHIHSVLTTATVSRLQAPSGVTNAGLMELGGDTHGRVLTMRGHRASAPAPGPGQSMLSPGYISYQDLIPALWLMLLTLMLSVSASSHSSSVSSYHHPIGPLPSGPF